MADWETYADAAERLCMTADAVRHRARRMHWRRMRANDGRTLIMVPDDIEPIDRPDNHPMIDSAVDRSSPDRTADQFGTIEALQERIADLQADLERERREHAAAIDREREERLAERNQNCQLTNQLIDAEKAKAEIEKAAALSSAEASQHASRVEELRTTLAEMQNRPWWRRLVG